MTGIPFWERPEMVERFAARPPDRRLLALLDRSTAPAETRVLDLGCAGGRNAEVLALRGFDLAAIDSSEAMVEMTRIRVGAVLGEEEAHARVRVGSMEDLSRFGSGSFRLVVALGVFHNADGDAAWDRSVGEAVRVLAPGDLLLYAGFSPRSKPRGSGLKPVRGERHLYGGFESGPLYLLEPRELDENVSRFGLVPETITEAVRVETDTGHRVTVNGLFCKTGAEARGR